MKPDRDAHSARRGSARRVSLMLVGAAMVGLPRLVVADAEAAVAPAKIFVVNSRGDAPVLHPGAGTAHTGGSILRNGQPEPEITLRSALTESDMTNELDEIRFDVPGALVEIFPQGSLRGILGTLRPVIVDGTTQPGDGIVVIDGSQAGTHDPAGREMVGMELVGSGSTFRGLFITRFAFDGVRIRPSGGAVGQNTIERCVIQSNERHGVYISESPGNVIGGTSASAMNVITLNKGNGVRIEGPASEGNRIQGNRIGTDRTGTLDHSNLDDQIAIDQAPGTIIGSPDVAPAPPSPTDASNVIVGKRLGINIDGLLTTSTSTKVNANFLGLDHIDATLTGGILSNGSLLTAGGNVITKVSGVEIQAFFQVNGTVDIRHNVLKADAIEGINLRFDEGREMTMEMAQNVIVNARRGVVAEESLHGKFIWNALGIDIDADEDAILLDLKASGDKVFGGNWNAQAGVALQYRVKLDDSFAARLRVEAEARGSQGGVVGSIETAALFSYDAFGGKRFGGAGSGDKVTVGVGFTGRMEAHYRDIEASLSAEAGFWLENKTGFRPLLTAFFERTTARENIVGINLVQLKFGDTATDCIVVNNRDAGFRLSQDTDGRILNSTIAGNGIGVEILDTSHAIIAGNILSGNGFAVVAGGTGLGTQLVGNSIFANFTLGIDLGANGVTPNDAGDTDSGPNNFQNFPVLASATSSASGTTIVGTLSSTPSRPFTLEFFSNTAPHPSGHGEGEIPLGSASVSTDTSGLASFTVPLPTVVAAGRFVTSTATDAAGNTSEFSANILVSGGSGNVSPVAMASVAPGAIVGQVVTLNGSGSLDPDGGPKPLTFSWTQLSGPPTTLSGANSSMAQFTPTVAGPHGFRLTVSDGLATASADVSFSVAPPGNIAPLAVASVAPGAIVGQPVALDGSGSSDPDAGPNPLSFSWTQLSGPTVVLAGANSAIASFTPSVPAPYSFRLSVGDGLASALATVAFTVAPAGNRLPVANAGPDQTVAAGEKVDLDGRSSFDPDGGPLTFLWSQVAGPAASLGQANSSKPKFTPSQPGNYEFRLLVSDGQGSATDLVTIHVHTGQEQALRSLIGDTRATTLDAASKAALLARLQQALAALIALQVSEAITHLQEFESSVQALRKARILPPKTANDLAHQADKILKALEDQTGD